MTAAEARKISFYVNKPALAEKNGYLSAIKYAADKGKYYTSFNTSPPHIDGLKLIKELGFRIFIRQSIRNVTGYPYYFIWWGENENPFEEINVGDDKKYFDEL